MKYSVKTGTLSEISVDCLVASLNTAKGVAADVGASDTLRAASTDFENKPGSVLMVPLPRTRSRRPRRLLVVGGTDKALAPGKFRAAIDAAAAALTASKATTALWTLGTSALKDSDTHQATTWSLLAISRAAYRFQHYKSEKGTTPTLKTVSVHADGRTSAAARRAVREGNALRAGMDWCKDLANHPPNVCNPTYLLRVARTLAKHEKVTVTALDEKRMESLNMGAFLSVTRGTATPAKMIIIRYQGATKDAQPVALVGKGITFDTGGISLKPPPAMDEMKFDMGGAAAVLGATKAAIEASLKINLVTIVAAAENMPGSRASRPGDIVQTHAGKSVEILNTDAEGRLVLCDALSYVKRYKPKAVVDVATLTGACIVALGSQASGLFTADDTLANDILDAGEWSGDRAWRMPVWDEYKSALKSNFADIANVGGRDAGAVTAACFLSEFTDGLKWAHMDVAGTAFQGGPKKGATGRPVPLLFRYLTEQ